MKDRFEVLRRKEVELERLRREVEALRVVGKLLSERNQGGGEAPRGKVLGILPE